MTSGPFAELGGRVIRERHPVATSPSRRPLMSGSLSGVTGREARERAGKMAARDGKGCPGGSTVRPGRIPASDQID